MQRAIRCLAAGVWLAAASWATAQTRPAVFQDLEFKAARAAAVRAGKLLVLDAMTSWCGPCKRMDREVWNDPALAAWIAKHAVAVQLDMDVHPDVKTALGIHAFPTIVLLKDGKEFDRVVGYRTVAEMRTWLADALENKTSRDRAREALARLRGPDRATASLDERIRVADALLAGGDHEDAAIEYEGIWKTIAGRHPDRYAFLRGALKFKMKELALRHPPARDRFAAIRDAVEPGVRDGSAGPEELRDWIELNEVVGEDRTSVEWAVAAAASETGRAALRRLERRLFGLLVRHGEWRVAGLVLNDPVARIRQMGAGLGAYDVPTGKAPSTAATPAGGMPAIPLGGMRPARQTEPGDGERKPEPAPPEAAPGREKTRAVPAIPLGGMKPSRKAVPRPRTPEEIAAEVRRRLTWQLRETAGHYYAALLSAAREAEAASVAAALLEHADDAASRAALVLSALDAGQIERARPRHRKWLREIAY